jgi:acetyl esterase/lipase
MGDDKLHRWALIMAALSGLSASIGARAQALMTWADLTRAPAPHASRKIDYGKAPNQFAELWLPDRPGPHPVVLMIHGGCWQARIANLHIMDYIAEDLRRRGIAVWNIEYRGVDQPGGGYPGTFQDVARAADALPEAAAAYDLDLRRVVAVGHSAGGHLGFWLAGRPRLPSSSPLRAANPLPIAAAVSLGGLPDLDEDRTMKDAGCGAAAVERLTGQAQGRAGDVYADTSPAELLPLGVPQLMVQGELDTVSPPFVGGDYQAKAKARGERVRAIVIAGAGHVELIAPQSRAWAREVGEVQAVLHPPPQAHGPRP